MIGSNNTTKELETSKASGIISKFFEGFTILSATGFWKSTHEKSMVVEILTDDSQEGKVYEMAGILKQELKQESIGLDAVPSNFQLV